MGNSGSTHNIGVDDMHQHMPREYLNHHKHYREGNNHQNFRNSRQPSNHLAAPIKVLPDPNGVPARLRTTNNGAILNSGGTISGKKITGNGLYRSQSISATHHQSPQLGKSTGNPPPYQMQRSQTLLHFNDRKPAQDITNFQSNRYGSQPELRADEKHVGGPVSLAAASAASNSKFSKSKKKKPAPQAPLPVKEYEPSRFGWKQPTHQTFSPPPKQEMLNALPPTGQGRKMRLFKTKAESKKLSPTNRQSVDPDMQTSSNYLPDPKRQQDDQFQSLPFQRAHIMSKQQTSTQERKPSFPKVSLFRREKSFDITLMQDRNKQKEIPQARTSVRRPSPELQKKIISKPKPLPPKEPEKPVTKSTFRKPPVQKQQSPQPATLPTSDFQKELLMATRRRSSAANRTEKVEPKEEKKTEPAPVKALEVKKEEKIVIPVVQQPPISQEPAKQQHDSRKLSTTSGGEPKPQKSFYFGMDSSGDQKTAPEQPMNKEQLDLIDRFAESILNRNKFAVTSQESAMSSDTASLHSFLETETDAHEIALKLRPTLPRKQFEVPRFSPVAAWRLLTADDESKENTTEWYSNAEKSALSVQLLTERDENIHDEERIERIYREPVPGLQDNKSGDSGISGDAGPDEPSQQIQEESPLNDSYMSAWTPQQDLGDDDDDERVGGDSPPINDFSTKGHIFSLSLPRELHLSDKSELQSFNSLQKLKRTVSGAFSSHNESENDSDQQNSRNDNWFLSRSGHNSLESSTLIQAQSKSNDKKKDALGNLTSGKHVMYLPNSEQATLEYSMDISRSSGRDYVDEYRRDDIQVSQDDSTDKYSSDVIKTNIRKISKARNHHRFTFQSTVRQVERRKIADKLSREAEEQEAQRLSELEAMQRVEEEFQKKRAREKASIRHQLRIFSLEEGHQSLPVDWETNNERVEPEGAVSSPSPSPRPSSPAPAFTNMFKRPMPVDDQVSEDYRDSKTPYIKRIIEEKSSKFVQRIEEKVTMKPDSSVLMAHHRKISDTNNIQITAGSHGDKIIQIMGWSDRHQTNHFK